MSVEYWEKQPTDQPWTLNGFNGTWNFSDHNLIPEGLRSFIFENFPKVERFKRIPLEDINKLMNEVWEGPGSMVKIARLTRMLKAERMGEIKPVKEEGEVRTINDYSDEEMVSFSNDKD